MNKGDYKVHCHSSEKAHRQPPYTPSLEVMVDELCYCIEYKTEENVYVLVELFWSIKQ